MTGFAAGFCLQNVFLFQAASELLLDPLQAPRERRERDPPAEAVGDLAVRQPLPVMQHDERPVGLRKPIKALGQRCVHVSLLQVALGGRVRTAPRVEWNHLAAGPRRKLRGANVPRDAEHQPFETRLEYRLGLQQANEHGIGYALRPFGVAEPGSEEPNRPGQKGPVQPLERRVRSGARTCEILIPQPSSLFVRDVLTFGHNSRPPASGSVPPLESLEAIIADSPTPSRLHDGLTFTQPRSMIQAADNGDLATGLELFEEMEQKDATLHSVADVRRVALTGLPYEIASAAETQDVVHDLPEDRRHSPRCRHTYMMTDP